MRRPPGANGTFVARRDRSPVIITRRVALAGYATVTLVPLVLYVIGAAFLALAMMFVLEAKVVRPANRRDALANGARASARWAAPRRVGAGGRAIGGAAALD